MEQLMVLTALRFAQGDLMVVDGGSHVRRLLTAIFGCSHPMSNTILASVVVADDIVCNCICGGAVFTSI